MQPITFHSQYTKIRLRNMLKICLVFWKSGPQYAYKRYAYKKSIIYVRILEMENKTVDSLLVKL